MKKLMVALFSALFLLLSSADLASAQQRFDFDFQYTVSGSTAEVGETVTLTATQVNAINISVISWVVASTSPAGSTVNLSETLTGVGGFTRSFVADVAGQYIVDVRGTDPNNTSGTSRTKRLVMQVGKQQDTAPVADPISITVRENTPETFVLKANDADGDPLTYSIVALPSHGSVTLDAGSGRTATYTPASGFVGSDSFTYRASDGTASSNVATVTITVTPQGNTVTVTVQAGGPYTVTLPNTLRPTCTYTVTNPPSTISSVTKTWAQMTGPTGGVAFSGNPVVATFAVSGSYNIVCRVIVQFSDGSQKAAAGTATVTVKSAVVTPLPTCAFTGRYPLNGGLSSGDFKLNEVAGATRYHFEFFENGAPASGGGFTSEPYFQWYPPHSGRFQWRVQALVGGVWCESDILVVEIPSLTDTEDEGLPTEFTLHGNYPNPFNPATTISFELPSSEHVTLEVYDLQGRMVKGLVLEVLSAGTHEVRFDASELPSGAYIYRLQAGKGALTGTMVLLK